MSAETLAHPDRAEVARIAAHLPCLEAAAADPSAAPEARQVLREQIARFRVVLTLLGADLGEAGRDC
ncbi:hypothetical protein [Streptosporangium canum]|uniref:hypothetical protein n=1 Tax=Streptosporangium canum TaxID=324952 RepID=UPI00378F9567